MKAVKTIVATAVIVFALTTVAMAGVQRLGGAGEPANAAQTTAAPATAETAQWAAQQGDSVALSAQQFTALLDAVTRDRAQDRLRTAAHSHRATGTHAQTHTHAQTLAHAAAQTRQAAQTSPHTETHHTGTHAATHVGGTHSGSHDTGTHSGGHDGGCD